MKLNIQLFAASMSESFSESNISIEQNKSSVTVTVTFTANNNKTYFSNRRLYCWVDTIEQSRLVSLEKGGTVTESFTFDNIAHNEDGTKTIDWEWYINTGTSVIGTIDRIGTHNLTTIARATTPVLSSSSVELNSSVSITLTPASNTFTHDLTYSIGTATGTIATGVGSTTVTFTPPIYLARQITTSTSGTCVISCKTYKGTDLIGTKNVNLTLEVPSAVVPHLTIGTITEIDTTMLSLNWGVYVQNKSKINIPITAVGAYDSTITGTSTSVNGTTYTTTNINTGVLTTSGTNTITSTVTDSRSRTNTQTETISVVSYSNPSITTAYAIRSNSNGDEDDEGTYIKYSFAGSISPVSNNNSHLFRLWYKQKSSSTYNDYFDIDTTNYSINKTGVLNANLSTNSAYDIQFEVSDSFTNTSLFRKIETGFDLMNFNASGKSMAIGKVSEAGVNDKLIEINLDTQILKDLSVTGDTTIGDLTSTGDITTTGDITANNYVGAWGSYTNNIGTKDINSNDVLVKDGTTIKYANILESGVDNNIYYEKRR